MTYFSNIDECEKEVEYLREQNQKLINELSEVSKENALFREQLSSERNKLKKILDKSGKKHRPAEDLGEDDFCLN